MIPSRSIAEGPRVSLRLREWERARSTPPARCREDRHRANGFEDFPRAVFAQTECAVRRGAGAQDVDLPFVHIDLHHRACTALMKTYLSGAGPVTVSVFRRVLELNHRGLLDRCRADAARGRGGRGRSRSPIGGSTDSRSRWRGECERGGRRKVRCVVVSTAGECAAPRGGQLRSHGERLSSVRLGRMPQGAVRATSRRAFLCELASPKGFRSAHRLPTWIAFDLTPPAAPTPPRAAHSSRSPAIGCVMSGSASFARRCTCARPIPAQVASPGTYATATDALRRGQARGLNRLRGGQ